MRVESGKVFSILAHELRSPLGVIQGYVRMLRMRRADDDQETRMLTAMLDATGRISAVARQASELALWQECQPPGEPTTVPVGTLVERVAASALPRPISTSVPGDLRDSPVPTWQTETLAAAIAAIVVAAERNTPDRTIGLHVERAGSDVVLMIGDESALEPGAALAVETADTRRAEERLFGGGGQGLSLVLAASVLDCHGISVGLIESPSEIAILRLPKDRGRQ